MTSLTVPARPCLIRTAIAPDPIAYRWLLSSLFGGYRGPSPSVPPASRAPMPSPESPLAANSTRRERGPRARRSAAMGGTGKRGRGKGGGTA
jgi:hypothetical protein